MEKPKEDTRVGYACWCELQVLRVLSAGKRLGVDDAVHSPVVSRESEAGELRCSTIHPSLVAVQVLWRNQGVEGGVRVYDDPAQHLHGVQQQEVRHCGE